jgi:hypothetical protein
MIWIYWYVIETELTDMFSHLDAIDLRLSNERARVSSSKKVEEREWREHNVRMIEREREDEIAFLETRGFVVPSLDEVMNDDELLEMLGL